MHANRSENATEHKRENQKSSIPRMRPHHGLDAHEHEDQGLVHIRQHMNEILDCCVGFAGEVCCYVSTHRHATKHCPIEQL